VQQNYNFPPNQPTTNNIFSNLGPTGPNFPNPTHPIGPNFPNSAHPTGPKISNFSHTNSTAPHEEEPIFDIDRMLEEEQNNNDYNNNATNNVNSVDMYNNDGGGMYRSSVRVPCVFRAFRAFRACFHLFCPLRVLKIIFKNLLFFFEYLFIYFRR
jgi:hypothetical protein